MTCRFKLGFYSFINIDQRSYVEYIKYDKIRNVMIPKIQYLVPIPPKVHNTR